MFFAQGLPRFYRIVVAMLVSAGAGCSGPSDAPVAPTPAAPTPAAPSVTQQPQPQNIVAPGIATFRVEASGTAPLTYQWRKGINAIAGANQSSYSTPATSAVDSGSVFSVVVSNSVGSITSASVNLLVLVSPYIIEQPQAATAGAGQPATFRLAASGSGPLSYQWLRGSIAIPGATASTYTMPAVLATDNGAVFAANVTNSAGTVTSAAVTLTVSAGPVITQRPRIAYACYQGTDYRSDVCAKGDDGTNSVIVVHSFAVEDAPTWSPDGSRIAYVSDAGGFPGLWVVNADGSNARSLASLHGKYPAWSPDGRKIAYQIFSLMVANADGTGETRVVADSMGADRPAWSPDGKRLAFGTTWSVAVSGGTGIWIVNADGTGLTRVTTGAGDGYPTWSADGRRIALSNNGNIDVVNVDGSARRRLYANGSANDPAWSPANDQIAFTVSYGLARIWIMNADGSGLHMLSPSSPYGYGESYPAWHP